MKKVFYFALLLLLIFEVLVCYLLMPFPGSQQLNSIQLIYFLHQYRWYVEIPLIMIILYTILQIIKKKQFTKTSLFVGVIVLFLCFIFRYILVADYIYKQPQTLEFKGIQTDTTDLNMTILGIEHNGEAKAYPIPYLIYHHQIIDSIGHQQLIATYCGLCKTGRFFAPFIDGKHTTFRLVGVNHYNAMLEDKDTKSWWSQETGICIAGKLKGKQLQEISSTTMSLHTWLITYPQSKIMQPDPQFLQKYKKIILNGEHLPNNSIAQVQNQQWDDHSLIIGITKGTEKKAFEWTYLVKKQFIYNTISNTDIVIILHPDSSSFTVFENPNHFVFSFQNDTLFANKIPYNLAGINLQTNKRELIPLTAYREFWFSWRYANPTTTYFKDPDSH